MKTYVMNGERHVATLLGSQEDIQRYFDRFFGEECQMVADLHCGNAYIKAVKVDPINSRGWNNQCVVAEITYKNGEISRKVRNNFYPSEVELCPKFLTASVLSYRQSGYSDEEIVKIFEEALNG
jgi:hypothetical protein